MASDIFRNINEQDDATFQRVVERLESRGKYPGFREMLDNYLDRLSLQGNCEVLILGCGTGMEARILAARPEFNGHITGVDLSSKLVEVARILTAKEGLEGVIDFLTGDATLLEFDDTRFDAVIAHTLISHVPEPLSLLREAARVLKPHGSFAVFDGDYASLTFGYSDEVFGKRIEEAIISTVVNNPRVMRSLPRLLPLAGLNLEFTVPHLLAEIGEGNFFMSAAETYGPLVSKAGLIPSEEVEAWLGELRLNHHSGSFFAAGNYYTFITRKI
jgi:ubiquinone/menaquinone biosynthesis C-methylase UbiE